MEGSPCGINRSRRVASGRRTKSSSPPLPPPPPPPPPPSLQPQLAASTATAGAGCAVANLAVPHISQLAWAAPGPTSSGFTNVHAEQVHVGSPITVAVGGGDGGSSTVASVLASVEDGGVAFDLVPGAGGAEGAGAEGAGAEGAGAEGDGVTGFASSSAAAERSAATSTGALASVGFTPGGGFPTRLAVVGDGVVGDGVVGGGIGPRQRREWSCRFIVGIPTPHIGHGVVSILIPSRSVFIRSSFF